MKMKRSEIIKEAIKAHGYNTVRSFCLDNSIAPSSVYNLFGDDDRLPSVYLLLQLAEALDIDINYLVHSETETDTTELQHNVYYCKVLKKIKKLSNDDLNKTYNFIKYCLNNDTSDMSDNEVDNDTSKNE